jgi:hypothetical protein
MATYVTYPVDPPYGAGCTMADHEDPPGGDIYPHWHCRSCETGNCLTLHRTADEADRCDIERRVGK